MILGIDASNIRGGGGVTHLVELLKAAEPEKFQFKKVIVWAGSDTLSKISEQKWLEKSLEPLLDKSLVFRTFWQRFLLPKRLTESKCDLLFVPGGSYSGNFHPFVTMSQNLLPFEWSEIRRYGFSMHAMRLVLLRFIQSQTFQKAQGTIFLTEFARRRVLEQFPMPLEKTTIINHGINSMFYRSPRPQKDLKDFTTNNPAKILYVSFIGEYKHQWNVVKAIGLLNQVEYPVQISFVGYPIEKKAFKKFTKSIQEVDTDNKFIKYYDKVSYEEIEQKYKDADIFLFASSCETFGQIVTEAMASALPIACSKLSSMFEILGEDAIYFNPESPNDISQKLEIFLKDKKLREKLSFNAHEKSKKYSWKLCADRTFDFLYSMYENSKDS
ncbi:MAG: glycosyltransferase family 4 protein [Leptospiraceae bacterium]|nr:glycosyltransferase family 4 protein [Leptospiraceae bacterium]